MELNLAVTFILVTTNAFLGAFVTFKDIKNRSNRLFGLLVVTTIIWILSNYFANTQDYNQAFTWNKIAYASSALIPYVVFQIAAHFATNYKVSSVLRLVVATLTGLVFCLSLYTPYIITGIKLVSFGSEPILASTFFIHPIFFVLVSIFAIYILYKQNQLTRDRINKDQLKYLTFGIFLSLIFGFLFNVVIPLIVNSYEITQYGTLSTLFLVGFIAYAILKHRLFDIKVILTEGLIYIIVIFLLIDLLLSTTWQQWIVGLLLLIAVAYVGYLLIKSVYGEIKKRKELQKITLELRATNERLSELDALKTEFVSMASHELLTPISAIQGYLSMLLDEKIIPLGDKRSEEILRKVHSSSDQVARLVTDLLNVSRIESGRIMIDKKRFDLNKVIRNSVSEIKIKADQKDLTMAFKQIELPEVYADPDRVKGTLTNLLGNAIKYTIKGGVSVWTTIEKNKKLGTRIEGEKEYRKGVRTKGDFIVVHIQDTGVGIKNEELPMLFRKFHRIGDWKTRNTGGTGLGLYISKNMVELLGGTIWADSKYGKGSTFSFSIPIAIEK